MDSREDMEPFDNTQANQEGWGIFDCDGSSNGPYQLQKIDEDDAFPDDDVAWAYVVRQARCGSAYHNSAIEYLRKHNPIEIESFAKVIAEGTCPTCKFWSALTAKDVSLCMSPHRNHDLELTNSKSTCIAYEWGLPTNIDSVPADRRDQVVATRTALLIGVKPP